MADDLSSTLAGAKRIANALGFACMLPGKTPDFTFCGGPAAEAYWNYFTPARIAVLLAAIENHVRPISAGDRQKVCYCLHDSPCPDEVAITNALTGTQLSEDGKHGK